MASKGANKLKGKAYRDSKKRERNKLRKLSKHLTKFPADMDAVNAQKETLKKVA